MEDYEELIEGVPKIIEDPRTGTRYNRGELLGRGGFGKCYLFTDLGTRKKYAGKVIMKSTLNWKLSMIYKETSIQISLRHPNILRMFWYFYCSTYVCMTMELCDGTLENVLKKFGVMDEPSCRFVVREVARGLSHLHENRIIHRDLKPENIFLTNDMDVKIGDFGIATRYENPAKKIMEAYGTITYLAPESIDGSGYSFGVDVWALGVTLYVMVVGHVPFDDMFDPVLYEKIKSCDYHIPSTVPTDTEDIIKSLLTRNPDSRPAIDDILKLEYFSSESISKHHLRGYILGEPSTNINNQENLNEYNAMSLSRNESIFKEDCKLNPKSGIEEVFQKGFRLTGTRGFRGYTWMVFKYDNSHGNENIPEKEFKLDIEKKSGFILKEVQGVFKLLSCRGPKIVSSSEMDSWALSSFDRPKHFVARWIDFNEMYGLGYQLSDSSVGVLFKDNTRLVVDGAIKNYQYIDENGAREYFEHDKCPTMLGKRFKLLEYFKNYMETYLSAEEPVEEQEENKVVGNGIPIILKWKRNDKCICFLLFNGVLQVNFRDDHTKVIISIPTKSVSIIDKDNKLKTYLYLRLALCGWDEFMKEKMSYVKKVVEEWTSHKRKHKGDNDDAVPAKKPNNNK